MKLKKFLDNYFPTLSRIFILIGIYSAVVLVVSKLSADFSDFYNRNISSAIRFLLSKLTGVLPFSLGEALFLCLPLFVVSALLLYFCVYSKSDISAGRFVAVMFSVVCLMLSLHVNTFGVAYNGRELSDKLNIAVEELDYEQLEHTAYCIIDELDAVVDDVDYRYNSSSAIPYSYDELNQKLNEAYLKISKKHSFIPALTSNVKILGVSPIMTYTHISGIFTYYTGEANVNINYPDYTLPYTMAHEMAHQRGIAPEDEANFVAFLVCLESDDSYIRYSGCISMLEYVMSAMRTASSEKYQGFVSQLDLRYRGEFVAFNNFFEKYRSSTASKISNTINDTYLKASGEESGSRSYGMVVDLACAYFSNEQ